MNEYSQLDNLKARLDALRPLPAEVAANLHEDLVLRWTYHSNAIEGNTLTLLETKVALEGITVGGKTLREHLEATNHRDAIAYVEAVVRDEEPFSAVMIRTVHALILKNIDDANAGVWRKYNVTISGARHVPPESAAVPGLMDEFVAWHQGPGAALHPVERAARSHSEFLKVHPFSDGNGRTARLLMNLDLMRAGYPPMVLPVERRLEYYEALDRAHVDGEYAPFLGMIRGLAAGAFAPYWRALGVEGV